MILHHHRIEPTLGTTADAQRLALYMVEDDRREHMRRWRLDPAVWVVFGLLIVAVLATFWALVEAFERLQVLR